MLMSRRDASLAAKLMSAKCPPVNNLDQQTLPVQLEVALSLRDRKAECRTGVSSLTMALATFRVAWSLGCPVAERQGYLSGRDTICTNCHSASNCRRASPSRIVFADVVRPSADSLSIRVAMS